MLANIQFNCVRGSIPLIMKLGDIVSMSSVSCICICLILCCSGHRFALQRPGGKANLYFKFMHKNKLLFEEESKNRRGKKKKNYKLLILPTGTLLESRAPLSLTWFYPSCYLVVDHFLWNKNKIPTQDGN